VIIPGPERDEDLGGKLADEAGPGPGPSPGPVQLPRGLPGRVGRVGDRRVAGAELDRGGRRGVLDRAEHLAGAPCG
jgi:hypothetical protein